MIKKILFLYFIKIVLCYNINSCCNYFTTNSYLSKLNYKSKELNINIYKNDFTIKDKIVNYDDIIISLCNNNVKKILMPTSNNLMVLKYNNNDTKYFYDFEEMPKIINIINDINSYNLDNNFVKVIRLPDYFKYFYYIYNYIYDN